MVEYAPMSNEYTSREIEPAPRVRLAYGAVPLRPWQAVYPGLDKGYYAASREHLEAKAHRAIAESTMSDEEKSIIGDFLLESLLATHVNRIDYNHDSFETLNSLHDPCPELRYAYDGLATPHELVDILQAHLTIGALELAKLSHPLDFAESRDMDDTIAELLVAKNARFVTTETRYKRKRLQPDIPALIVARKTELGDVPAPDGVIRITQRQSLLVRGDLNPDDIALARIVRNEQRFDELTRRIEGYFSSQNFDPHNQFVQPAATSYYAKYLDAQTCANLGIELF